MAHTIILVVYCMLRDGTHYQDLSAAYFEQQDRQAVVQRSIRRLERLGYTVTLEAA